MTHVETWITVMDLHMEAARPVNVTVVKTGMDQNAKILHVLT